MWRAGRMVGVGFHVGHWVDRSLCSLVMAGVFVGIRKVFVGFRGYSVVCLKVFVGIRYNRNGGLTLESGVTACAGGAEQPGRRQARGRAWWVGAWRCGGDCRLPAMRVRNAWPATVQCVCGLRRARTAVCACSHDHEQLRALSISDSDLEMSVLARSFSWLFTVSASESMIASMVCRAARG